jgi:hypothetical protein
VEQSSAVFGAKLKSELSGSPMDELPTAGNALMATIFVPEQAALLREMTDR